MRGARGMKSSPSPIYFYSTSLKLRQLSGAMDVGTAVGIASFGIQVCEGLLSYYDRWKSYESNISAAYDCIADLGKTFTLLQDPLGGAGLDPARAVRVKECLDSCIGGLEKLHKKLQKLHTHSLPSGLRQKAWAEVQMSYYPFKESTIAKLREVVADLGGQLALALQVLQLELSTMAQSSLSQLDVSVAQVISQTQSSSLGVQEVLSAQQADQYRSTDAWLSPPDPWPNHDSARRRHEPDTGHWLLKSEQYGKWRAGLVRHLWFHGKAGCGKTVLCSTVIEDIRSYCECRPNAGFAMFYFTFSDKQKQIY